MAEGGADEARGEGGGEEELAGRQEAGLYPIGRALRATYGADNHDSLGSDLTTLMLNLARVEPPPPAPVIMPPSQPAASSSLLGRIVARLWPGTRR